MAAVAGEVVGERVSLWGRPEARSMIKRMCEGGRYERVGERERGKRETLCRRGMTGSTGRTGTTDICSSAGT